ncbi:hypothetical protein SAMN05444374_11640 [Rhodococcoides kroppenstedtii]|uniref:Uncharacterized protein n=1 Tax=Rhodococcoides kroppenstedtii TaxID=293050 RepID=A0A1I0U9U0_9NOCA|nr:hypothetical protein [Rhodococcus kroppenstedtii]SFA60852.1 hypothetical protein SAMN05444374_11640 [Rhodococcus kroppenstedtii]
MTSNPLADALKPVGLGDRGEALWTAFGGDTITDAARAVLVAEAARLADTLEMMDGLIRAESEAWATVELPEIDGAELKLTINPIVAERRQTVTVFRLTLAQLTNVAAIDGAAANNSYRGADGGDRPQGGVDEIKQRRDRRLADTADL